jgi:hypothetical protein
MLQVFVDQRQRGGGHKGPRDGPDSEDAIGGHWNLGVTVVHARGEMDVFGLWTYMIRL